MHTPPSKLGPHISIPVSSHAFSWFLRLNLFAAVLGIGERVGITPLGGLVACLYAANPDYVKAKYNLPMLREIENLVAEAVEVSVPFMNPITLVLIILGSSTKLIVTVVDIVPLPTRLVFTPRPSLTILPPTKSSSPKTLASLAMSPLATD
jgi:hypothetical protein